jgi:hypothetical protein
MTASASDAELRVAALLPQPSLRVVLLRLTMAMAGVVLLGQAAVVAKARPQDLITGVGGVRCRRSRSPAPVPSRS